ncbi:MAG: mechanosensitive ion channel family protein [Clostridiales bacterium]|nr:mechanosensitive ion channel family protein [Clostridiales bacterium]
MGILTSCVLTQDVAETITETVENNVNLISWDTFVQYFQDSLPTVLDFCMKVIIAVIVLLIGRKVIKYVMKFVLRSLEKSKLETGMQQHLSRVINVLFHCILILIVLGKFGITASSVIAIVGSAGLSIGLALQGALSNFAGGVLILMLHPFIVGDYIKEDTSGNEGKVAEIQLFYTKLVTLDNKVIMVPNSNLTSASLTNLTQQDRRRVDVKVGISYHADIRQTKEVLAKVVEEEELLLEGEPVKIYVDELAESSVVIGVMVWVKTEDYWPVKWRLAENIKYALDDNGIEIPFPQVTVSYAEESK